jgi:transposase-like protein
MTRGNRSRPNYRPTRSECERCGADDAPRVGVGRPPRSFRYLCESCHRLVEFRVAARRYGSAADAPADALGYRGGWE